MNLACSSVAASRRGELLDLDGADRLERDLLEVLVGDHDVLVGRVLVALHGLARERSSRPRRAPDLHLDPREVGLVEHVEPDRVLGLGRGVQLDRDGDQAELDGPLPHRACHGVLVRSCSESRGPSRPDPDPRPQPPGSSPARRRRPEDDERVDVDPAWCRPTTTTWIEWVSTSHVRVNTIRRGCGACARRWIVVASEPSM